MKELVVNKYHKKPYDIYIGRGSIWGNPFSHIPSKSLVILKETREESIYSHKEWILSQPRLLEKIPMLKGKVLGCFCKPKDCHGDTLVWLTKSRIIIRGFREMNEEQTKKLNEFVNELLLYAEDNNIKDLSVSVVHEELVVIVPPEVDEEHKEYISSAVEEFEKELLEG